MILVLLKSLLLSVGKKYFCDHILHNRTFPSLSLSLHVTFLLKLVSIKLVPRQRDRFITLNYRPITLTACFCKGFETIKRKIFYYLSTRVFYYIFFLLEIQYFSSCIDSKFSPSQMLNQCKSMAVLIWSVPLICRGPLTQHM